MAINPQNVPLPPPGGQIVDSNGMMSGTFFQFMQSLWLRTGGNVPGSTTVDATARAEALAAQASATAAQSTANTAQTSANLAVTSALNAELIGISGQVAGQSANQMAQRASNNALCLGFMLGKW